MRRRRWHARTRRGRLLPKARQHPEERGKRYPVSQAGARHGLTPAQAWEVRQLVSRKHHRPADRQWRSALRLAGAVSAVKGGRVGNRPWGQAMYRKRQGKLGQQRLRQHLAMRGILIDEYFQGLAAKMREAKRLKQRSATRKAYLREHPHERSWRIS